MEKKISFKRLIGWFGLIAGLSVVAGLVAWQGFSEVVAAVADIGWGFFWLLLVFPPHLVLLAGAWRMLFAPGREPPFWRLLHAIWIGSSVNGLIPTATIGGDVAKVRLLVLRGQEGGEAGASVVADKTVQALTVLIWALVGIAILIWLTSEGDVVLLASVGVGLLALGTAGFVAVQRAGAFVILSKLASRFGLRRADDRLHSLAERLDAAIREIYRRPGRLLVSCLLRLAGRVVLAGELWLAAWLMGYPITIVEAVLLRSIGVALRSAAFAVPSGIGVQEGAYVVIGGLVGLDAGVMLALSLVTRARELFVDVAGLIAWQHAEGRALWRRRNSRATP